MREVPATVRLIDRSRRGRALESAGLGSVSQRAVAATEQPLPAVHETDRDHG